MFPESYIGAAVTELWQLAMAMASLKYIIGMKKEVEEEDIQPSPEYHTASSLEDELKSKNSSLEKYPSIKTEENELVSLTSKDNSTEPKDPHLKNTMAAQALDTIDRNELRKEDLMSAWKKEEDSNAAEIFEKFFKSDDAIKYLSIETGEGIQKEDVNITNVNNKDFDAITHNR